MVCLLKSLMSFFDNNKNQINLNQFDQKNNLKKTLTLVDAFKETGENRFVGRWCRTWDYRMSNHTTVRIVLLSICDVQTFD